MKARHVVDTNFDVVTALDAHSVTGLVRRNGRIEVTVLDGTATKTATATVSDLPPVIPLKASWNLTLEAFCFNKIERHLTDLASWTEDPEIAHFSGTGTYRTVFAFADDQLRPSLLWTLNLGKVGDIAEVIVNGKNVGTVWMQPYLIDITSALKPGLNDLTILVTNTLINYVSGLKELPEVPEDLRSTFGVTNDSYVAGAGIWNRLEKNFHPLPDSGLIGPVKLIPSKKVVIRFS